MLLVFWSTAKDSEARRRPFTFAAVFNSVVAGDSNKMTVVDSQMLSTIIQSTFIIKATKLEDVSDLIEYLSSAEKDVDMHLCTAGGSENSGYMVLPRLPPPQCAVS